MKRIAEPAILLDRGLRELGLDAALQAPLLVYLAELVKWNGAYNLTAVRDPAEMVTRHLLDSLAVLAALDSRFSPAGANLIDIGAGAGLPGIPLALARPGWRIVLLDSNGKKARFLRHVQRTLGLDNVEVAEARAEDHEPEQRADAVISRAFASLADFVQTTAHLLLADDGCWLAMKGRLDPAEIDGLPDHVYVENAIRLAVPGLREERHLVVIRAR